jgi:hypothetical protein
MLTFHTRTVAVTSSKSIGMSFQEEERVCQECTNAGLNAIYEAGPKKPFRFLYMSGFAAERDRSKPSKAPPHLQEATYMRVGTLSGPSTPLILS